jgi:hypothetical protein
MPTSLFAKKSLSYLCLVNLIFTLQAAHADVQKTSTGDCIITNSKAIEGGYRDPNTGKYWKYVPCDSELAKKESKKADEESKNTKQKTTTATPLDKLKGSLRGAVSKIRNNLRECLPLTANSCSLAPDTIPVILLHKDDPANAIANRPQKGFYSGAISLKPSLIDAFPTIVKKRNDGSRYINFEQLAQVCQALQNDPRYITKSGELSRRPTESSILNDYNAILQLSTLCHELIHLGECASCVSEVGTEKKAYEYEVRVTQKSLELAPDAIKPYFYELLNNRMVYVNYLTCRETDHAQTCFAQCVQAKHPTKICELAHKLYSVMKNNPDGQHHDDERSALDLGYGILGLGVVQDKVQENPENQSSGNTPEPTNAVTNFSLSDGTLFTCPAGKVGFKTVGSDSIERGYCCPAGSTTITVGTNGDAQCA